MPQKFDSDLLTREQLEEKYPHVAARGGGWVFDIVKEFGPALNNTGGNEPLDLLNDFLNPGTDTRPNRMMVTNVVRFTLASMVFSQVSLLGQLRKEGHLSVGLLEWILGNHDSQFVLSYMDPDGFTGIVYRDETGDVQDIVQVDYSYQPVDTQDVYEVIHSVLAEKKIAEERENEAREIAVTHAEAEAGDE